MSDKKPEPSDELNRALLDAAFVCDFVRVRELLAAGADPNVRDAEGRTPLFSAVLGSSLGLVGLLLEAGAEPNARDEHLWTPLHFAVQEFLPEIARVLVGRGADPNAQDEDGNTVLWRAIWAARGRFEIAQMLLKEGAKGDLANNQGETPKELAERLESDLFEVN